MKPHYRLFTSNHWGWDVWIVGILRKGRYELSNWGWERSSAEAIRRAPR